MSKIEIINDIDKSLEVMGNAAQWLLESGRRPSKWWLPENMNRDFMLKHSEPNEYFVALVRGKPVASMILQDNERNQSWQAIDGEKSKPALYVHWLCVHRDFAGQGLPKILIEFAVEEASKRGLKLIRVDTNADEKRLRATYEQLGFALMGTEKDGERTTAFYQREF